MVFIQVLDHRPSVGPRSFHFTREPHVASLHWTEVRDPTWYVAYHTLTTIVDGAATAATAATITITITTVAVAISISIAAAAAVATAHCCL